jgi:prepilin-type N-terminal cleavage/methylation domain-containing protein
MKKRGFTLIEILVYIAVLSIIILSVSSFFLWAVRSNAKTKIMRETLDNARRAMEIITYEIKEAESIYGPTSVFGSHPGQLSLETVKYLPARETATYIDFYLCGDSLCLKKESQNPVALTSGRVKISNLVFSQIATTTPCIQIDLTVDFKTSAEQPEYQGSINLSSVASLRNY